MFGGMSDDGLLLESDDTVAETISLVHELEGRGVPIAGIYRNIQTVLPGTALDDGLLDFYSMPRAPSFTEFEDGCVGYNFLTIAQPPDGERLRLAKTVSDATRSLVPASERVDARDASRRTFAVRP